MRWATKPASRLLLEVVFHAEAGQGDGRGPRGGAGWSSSARGPLPSGRPMSLTIEVVVFGRGDLEGAGHAVGRGHDVAVLAEQLGHDPRAVMASSSTNRTRRSAASGGNSEVPGGRSDNSGPSRTRASEATSSREGEGERRAPGPGPGWRRRGSRRRCPSAIDRPIASPSPSPPNRLVMASSPCSKALKMFWVRCAGSMPMPLSTTAMSMISRSASSRVRIGDGFPPSGVNLIPFLIRFQKTCWSLAGSALTMMVARPSRSTTRP